MPTGRVAGTVTYRGKPVPFGNVNLYQKGTGAGALAVIEDGRFRVADPLPVGAYEVYLTVTEPEPDPSVERKPTRPPFPTKYQNPATSGLVFEVKEGATDYPISLAD